MQAPLCLLLVGCVLYLFRSIYGECISSYPLNGGSYSLLLNTSSKAVAALGACLSVIAYVATGKPRPINKNYNTDRQSTPPNPPHHKTTPTTTTTTTGVVSAVTACNYLQTVLPFLDVPLASCALLLAFAVVVLLGLKESANVALVICCVHVATLLLLIALGFVYVLGNGLGELPANLALPFPDINTVRSVRAPHINNQLVCMHAYIGVEIEARIHSIGTIRRIRPNHTTPTGTGRRGHRGRVHHRAALWLRRRDAGRQRIRDERAVRGGAGGRGLSQDAAEHAGRWVGGWGCWIDWPSVGRSVDSISML